MARVVVKPKLPPTTIDRFLGLRINSTGDTQLELGESPNQINWRVTPDYKLTTRTGYIQLFDALESPIRGIWNGKLGSSDHLIFACDSALWLKDTLSGTDYASIDTATYTNVDVVKTTALNTSIAGTTGLDGFTIINDSAEVAQADIDLETSIGKHYYHTDKTIWLIVAKGEYADIAEARTGLEETIAYHHIGVIADAPTHLFTFQDKLYIQDGNEYYSWDGTTFATVAGYIPTIAISTPPAGGGTPYEQINLLTGKKKQLFSGDNSATEYQLAETNIDSVNKVYVNGALKVEVTDYSVVLATGKVTFTTAPSDAAPDNVEIEWTKVTAGNRSQVTACRAAMTFGGANDTRIHMWGNPQLKKS